MVCPCICMTGSHPCKTLHDLINCVCDPRRRAMRITSQWMVPITAVDQPYLFRQYSRISLVWCAAEISLAVLVVIHFCPIRSPAREPGKGIGMVGARSKLLHSMANRAASSAIRSHSILSSASLGSRVVAPTTIGAPSSCWVFTGGPRRRVS